VVAEDGEMGDCPAGREQCSRNEMRLRLMPFAEFSVRIGAAGIEVSQRDIFQIIGCRVVPQDLLSNEFRPSIWIDRQLRRLLGYGERLRNAIGCAAPRENDLIDSGMTAGVQKG